MLLRSFCSLADLRVGMREQELNPRRFEFARLEASFFDRVQQRHQPFGPGEQGVAGRDTHARAERRPGFEQHRCHTRFAELFQGPEHGLLQFLRLTLIEQLGQQRVGFVEGAENQRAHRANARCQRTLVIGGNLLGIGQRFSQQPRGLVGPRRTDDRLGRMARA